MARTRSGPRRPISDEVYGNAMADYVAGMKVHDIAKKWGISHRFIYKRLREEGRKTRMEVGKGQEVKPMPIRKLTPYAGKE